MELSFNFIPRPQLIKVSKKPYNINNKRGENHYRFRELNEPYLTKIGWVIKLDRNKKPIRYKRYIYAQHHKIDIGYNDIIRFKDGNIHNLNIDNLILIKRSELMNENHNREKASKTLIEKYKRNSLRIKYDLPAICKPKTKNHR